MTTKSRLISKLIDGTGQVKASLLDSDGISVSSQKSVTAAAGTTTYSSADTLPATATSGDQAFVTSTNRLYIYSGSGWYNIALVNNTPYWTTEAASSYDLAINSTPTVVTVLAVDSDGTHPNYIATADSDFNQIATLSRDSDNGRIFTITPLDSENGAAVGGTGTITFKASDGISLVSTVSTFTISFTVSNSNYTSLLLKADTTGTDNQVDASTNAHTITEVGNVTSTAFTPYHPGGYSTYFDGTDDYLGFDNGYIATNGTWWTSSGFTLEMWYYKTISRQVVLWDNRQSGTTGFMLNAYTDGYHMYNNGSWQFQSVGTEKLNQWVHVALVINGTALTLYENGISIHTDSVASTASYGYFGRTQNTLGAVQYTPRGGNTEFAGYMYDVRISDGSRYTTAFTPLDTPLENDSDTILLACSSPMLKDKSSNNHEITVFGDGINTTTRFGPFDYLGYAKADHGGSVYFDGTNDYLDAGDIQFGANDFTIEGWFYFNSTANQCLIGRFHNYSSNQCWELIYEGGLRFQTNTGSFNSGTASWTPVPNVWYHIAAVRSGSNKYLFINGILQSGYPINIGTGALQGESTGTVKIGTRHDLTKDFNGYMSDVRFVTGTAVYTSNFTPPTAPLTAITNTSLLTCTNKNDIWDAGAGKLITKNGNAVVSNTKRKFTTSSAMYFDGTGDWLNTGPSSNLLTMGTGDFTIECWVWKADTNHRGIFQIGSNAAGIDSNYAGSIGFGYQVGAWQIYAANTAINGSSFTLTSDTWYHAAMVRNNGTTKLYIDGSEEISVADTHNYVGTYMAIGGYYTTGYLHNGYIHDLRVTKGLARYTSNFTPPTSEFNG